MKILCYGSLNIDYTYSVEHFVTPGETLSSRSLERHPGGKGLNQAIALARGGAEVCMAGAIGTDGEFLRTLLEDAGVCTAHLTTLTDTPTGHAIIQRNGAGENCILLFGGANRAVTREQIDAVLAQFAPGDLLLVQNEISQLGWLVTRAHALGLRIALNPSPMDEAIQALPYDSIDYLILNEIEAGQLLGNAHCDDIPGVLQGLHALFPHATVVLTLGSRGAWLSAGGEAVYQPVFPVTAVDTTGAGDTFTGYFLATQGEGGQRAMELAAMASAIAVTRPGASSAIPERAEVEAALNHRI